MNEPTALHAGNTLPLGVVRVWLTTLFEVDDASHVQACQKILSPDERASAARFHAERDRLLYLSAHALLRRALSQCAPVPPQDWRFELGVHGKPRLAAEFAALEIDFNLSHTRGLACCAVARQADVGVDVERLSRRVNICALADRFFAPDEAEALRLLDGPQQRLRFFEYWTLKEAYLKARGVGLSLPLAGVSFRLASGWDDFRGTAADFEKNKFAVSFSPELDDAPPGWQFALCEVGVEHLLAVAVKSRQEQQQMEFHPPSEQPAPWQ